MSRPSFQFYTKDWRSNSKLRRCTPAARGVWVDILCALHDSDEYGIARYPLRELASEVGADMRHVRELVDKGVLKGSDEALTEAYVYVPRSGRKEGPPVALLDAQPGPIWYSSRMVKDEYVNTNRGAGTRFGDAPKPPPDDAPSRAPTRRQGDGPSSASSTATAVEEKTEALARAREGNVDTEGFTPTQAGLACRAMRGAGIAATNPGNLDLRALLEQGATVEEFRALAVEAMEKQPPLGDPFKWVLSVLPSRRAKAAAIRLAPAARPTVESDAASRTAAMLAADRMTPEQRAAADTARQEAMAKLRRTAA